MINITMNDLNDIMIEARPYLPKRNFNPRLKPAQNILYTRGKLTAFEHDATEYILIGFYLKAFDIEPKNTEIGEQLIRQYEEWQIICKRDIISIGETIHILTTGAGILDTAYYFEKSQSYVHTNFVRALRAYAKLFLDKKYNDVIIVHDRGNHMTPLEIKQLRKSLNMTIADMARYLECNHRFVRQLETSVDKKSHRKPSEAMLFKIKELKK